MTHVTHPGLLTHDPLSALPWFSSQIRDVDTPLRA